MSDEPPIIDDFIVLGVPDDAMLDDPKVMDKLEAAVNVTVANQYKGRPPRALLFRETQWLITSDWHDIEAFQPAHDCAACRAGNDQAIAFLKEFPNKRLAVGNIHYTEIW